MTAKIKSCSELLYRTISVTQHKNNPWLNESVKKELQGIWVRQLVVARINPLWCVFVSPWQHTREVLLSSVCVRSILGWDRCVCVWQVRKTTTTNKANRERFCFLTFCSYADHKYISKSRWVWINLSFIYVFISGKLS